MRLPNDIKLANEVNNIDLILGGHDHNYCTKFINNKWIIKSGCDFKNLSHIFLNLSDLKVSKIIKYTINSNIEENIQLKQIVDEFLSIKLVIFISIF